MKLTVLGASGGIGGARRTTCFQLDNDILVDAGTGLGDLSLEALVKIDHVFLTHAHFDHIACLPMLLDTVGGVRTRPVTVYALPEVISALRQHIFNGSIWPDFSIIPTPSQPFLRFQEIQLGEKVMIGERAVMALSASHTVPACGYAIFSESGDVIAFSGDTDFCPSFWRELARIQTLKGLIIECAFPREEAILATLAKHFQPETLFSALAGEHRELSIYITHLKPSREEQTLEQLKNKKVVKSGDFVIF